MAVRFTNPVVSFDRQSKLYHVKYTVTGNGSADSAVGVGDSEWQAKRHAITQYQKAHPRAYIETP